MGDDKDADSELHATINDLVAEQKEVMASQGDGTAADDASARLQAIQVELDRHYDLVRQRRAKRDAGADPDEAELRDADTVENYVG